MAAATIARLVALGIQQNAEAYWYPLWQEMLSPYTLPAYAAAGGGRTAQLSTAPQIIMRQPAIHFNTEPDFAVIQTVQPPGAAVAHSLFLVLDVKNRSAAGNYPAGVWATCQNQVNGYLQKAIAAFPVGALGNNPHNVVHGVACVGDRWVWRTVTFVPAAPGGPPAAWVWGAWSAVFNTATLLPAQFLL